MNPQVAGLGFFARAGRQLARRRRPLTIALSIAGHLLVLLVLLAPRPDLPGKRGFDGLNSAFHDNDLMVRVAGDTLVLTPPLIITEDQIGEIIEKVTKVIRATA